MQLHIKVMASDIRLSANTIPRTNLDRCEVIGVKGNIKGLTQAQQHTKAEPHPPVFTALLAGQRPRECSTPYPQLCLAEPQPLLDHIITIGDRYRVTKQKHHND